MIKGGSVVMPTYIDEDDIMQKKGFFSDLVSKKVQSNLIIKTMCNTQERSNKLLDKQIKYLPGVILFHESATNFL